MIIKKRRIPKARLKIPETLNKDLANYIILFTQLNRLKPSLFIIKNRRQIL